MARKAVKPEKIHGLLFDGAVFAGSIVLASRLPRLGDEVADSAAGILLLAAVLAQAAGAYGKRPYLRWRLSGRKRSSSGGLAWGFMQALLFIHFLLFTVMTLFGLSLLGIARLDDAPGFFQGDLWVLASLLAGAAVTLMVRSASQPGVRDAPPPGPGWLEYAADGLLWLSVILVTRFFWDGLLLMAEPAAGSGFSGSGLLLLAALSLLFVFFYLPCRYLFLVEDYRSPLTWLQLWTAMLPAAWLVFAG